ncbi:MAG: ferrous iron transport protein A [Ruminococcus sp.]|nr:ferrous iron transport protein A [Ruminococcus sp.]
MSLLDAKAGEEYLIKTVEGKPKHRRFLESLGFQTGRSVTVLGLIGNCILVVLDGSRVAVPETMAYAIMI